MSAASTRQAQGDAAGRVAPQAGAPRRRDRRRDPAPLRTPHRRRRAVARAPAAPHPRLRACGRAAVTLIALLVLACVRPAFADPAMPAPAAAGFDQALVGRVFGTALAFMAPRILDPVPIPELTSWGLGGITALDPSLSTSVDGSGLRLTSPAGVVYQTALPAADDPYAWGRAAAALCFAAWQNSPGFRSAGQDGVVQSFFDELFNHLDPYSRYVGPSSAVTDRDKREGTAGIGVTLAAGTHGLTITDTNPDGPAADAGLDEGDRILAIDGQDVVRATPEGATALLDGDPGSTVTLKLHRPHIHASATITLTRQVVPPETVSGISAGGLLILRITSFARDTAEQISTILDEGMREDHPTGLVFDLRGNRGGLLQQAITAAALLLDQGVAATARGRDPAANHVWSVQGGDITHGLPLVILVDGRTASAAEILAAALSDHGRAVVTGSSTLGKGLVQTFEDLPDGGEIFVTWSRVLAPLGWPIQGLGVLPQLCTSMGASQTSTELAALAGGVSLLRGPLAAERRSRPPLPVDRILEIRNTCPAAIGTDADLAAARSLLRDPAAYAAAIASIPRLDE